MAENIGNMVIFWAVIIVAVIVALKVWKAYDLISYKTKLKKLKKRQELTKNDELKAKYNDPGRGAFYNPNGR